MALFEALTAFSVAAALGIPTFMEKVMRPKYEERFSEFRSSRRSEFIDEFEKALVQLKQSKEEIKPETIEIMENVFNEWGQVKSDENRLSLLLKYRAFLFVGWLISGFMGLFSIDSSQVILVQPDKNLGQFTASVFIAMFVFSLWYGVQLFMLDQKLTEHKNKSTGESYGKTESIASSLETYRNAEQQVRQALDQLGIHFTENVLLERKGEFEIPYAIDFAVSTSTSKFFIEVKEKLPRFSTFDRLANRYKQFRKDFNAKTILVTDTTNISSDGLSVLRSGFDFIVDFKNLNKLGDIIKSQN